MTAGSEPRSVTGTNHLVILPAAQQKGQLTLEECLSKRRSVREYRDASLTAAEVAQLLWAAQGITATARRTAPSAGALYPLETYLVTGKVESLSAGVYGYNPASHTLRRVAEGDVRRQLAEAALSQDFLCHAPCSIVFTAVYRRTTSKYRERGFRYVHMEAGHAAQNVCLQAVALGLGCVTVGAFEELRLRQILPIDSEEEPLYLLAVGRR